MIYNLQNKCRGYQISCVAILELYFLKNLERLYFLEDPPSQRKATMLHYFTAVHLSVAQFLIFQSNQAFNCLEIWVLSLVRHLLALQDKMKINAFLFLSGCVEFSIELLETSSVT